MAFDASLATLHQLPQEATSVLPARLPDTQDSLDEPTAPAAVRATAALPPKDGMSQRPLGSVIRRLDLLLPYEGP